MCDISQILNQYPPDCQPTRVEPLGSAGGMSGAQFWRVGAPRGVLLLRRWPLEHPTPDHLRLVHAVLQYAAWRGIEFVPVPICTAAGETFVRYGGYLWEIALWMPGQADYELSPNLQKLQSALQALARFHVAVAGFRGHDSTPVRVGGHAESPPNRLATSPTISRRLTLLRDLQHGGIRRLSEAITRTTWPDLASFAQQFVAVLPTAIPQAIAQLAPLADVPFALQPCLRDIWHDHVLFTGDEVTGLVDFGTMDIDTPACDIARLLGSLVPTSPPRYSGEGPIDADTWQTGLAAYHAVRPLSADETRAVTALDTSGVVLAGYNWIRWIYIERREFENHAQVIERFRRIVKRMKP
jgi:homoserine kinase type II